MAKGGGNNSRKRKNNEASWTAVDHAIQQEKKESKKTKKPKLKQHERTAILTHNTQEKKDKMRLKLHITKIRREIKDLKQKLQNYDPIQEEEKRKKKLQQEGLEKKKGRKGPETWKLKGAARPAYQVYDFDVRYIDPHIEAHKNAKAKAKRSKNLLALYSNGRIHECKIQQEQEIIRYYLSLLMQLGYLCYEAKQYKSARETWLECIELEGNNNNNQKIITTARESLIKMYIKLEKYNDVIKFGGEQFSNDTSTWIRYSTALALIILSSQNNNNEEIQNHVIAAVKSNIFCAYYIVYYYNTFQNVMEYTEDIEDSDDIPQSTFEEALEYCTNIDHITLWHKTNGAIDILKHTIENLPPEDTEWNDRLKKIEDEYHTSIAAAAAAAAEKSTNDNKCSSYDNKNHNSNMDANNKDEDKIDNNDNNDDDNSNDDDNDHETDYDDTDENDDEEEEDNQERIDIAMYAGMYRTAMEMLANKGEIPFITDSSS